MTGRGRCRRRRKPRAGGRGAAAGEKIDGILNNHNLKTEITEKPSSSPKITKLPPAPSVDFLDLYTQARKVLSFTSPFDSEDSQARQAVVSSTTILPSSVSHLLDRSSDCRKGRKNLHSGSDKKSSTPEKLQESNIWVETEEYFRGLNVEDIERLDRSSINEKCFLIPFLDDDDNLWLDRMLTSFCKMDSLNLANSAKSNAVGKHECDGTIAQEGNGPQAMDVDNRAKVLEIKGDNNGEKRVGVGKDCRSCSGVEWLLGSRSKIYLTSERPSKKRKLLGRDAGLEKLLVARPVEDSESICHYCSYGDMGDPLNFLIKCSSCGMMVHQRCYGVQEDVDSSWLCSWCEWKNGVDLRTETPCLLCPKGRGALKPVRKNCFGSENDSSKMEFAHLFCCQWLPELYLENTRTMGPIINMDALKDTRRKLICYLCKAKYGACVRCSNGSCRTPFHPICAREAHHRMEVWGRLGSDEVELRAFCSKHSKVQGGSGSQCTEEISMTADSDPSKQKHVVFDGEELLDNRRNSEPHLENNDAPHPAALCLQDRKINNVNCCTALNFATILKKLIELGKVSATDVASEIGVSSDSLNTILTDDHMVPELQYKLLKWFKNHVHSGNLQNALKLKIKSLMTLKYEADATECVPAVSVEDPGISDAVPIKSVPPRRRSKRNLRTMKDDKLYSSKDKNHDQIPVGDVDLCPIKSVPPRRRSKRNLRTMKDDKLYSSKDKNHDQIPVGDVDLCLSLREDSNSPSGEFFADKTQKVPIDSQPLQDNPENCPIRIEDKVTALSLCLSDDGLVDGSNQAQEMIKLSFNSVFGDVHYASYIHPLIYSKLMQTNIKSLERSAFQHAVLMDREAPQLQASSSSDLCCTNNLQGMSGDLASKFNGENRYQLLRAKNLAIPKVSPSDEVEGELIYYQQRLLYNATATKHISDDLIAKVVRSLLKEIDATEERKWDTDLVTEYIQELREAKRLRRKERRQEEAQAVLATAIAAAASSSRMPSIRKDVLEESSQQDILKKNISDVRLGSYSMPNFKVKETIPRSAVERSSLDTNSDSVQLASTFTEDLPRTCDICRLSETVLNPISLCSSCKVAVHMNCYCSVKSMTIPWRCELCEDLFSLGSGARATSSWEKPYLVAKCGLCGGSGGAFRKSEYGQWIHAFCAEWVLNSTYRRGQVNPIKGMDTVGNGADTCNVCRHKQGVCLKCSYGHCQSKFHPICAKSANFYMTVRTVGGKLQHKAYCEKHSKEQKTKVGIQRHRIDEFKSLRQVRGELERLRLLCERIFKREKLKCELVHCSHQICATRRDSVLSALARHPFYQPEFSPESATVSVRGFTDSLRSGSELLQRSDDMTDDSMVAGKKRVKHPISIDNGDSSTPQNLYPLKPPERVSYSGKQISRRAIATQSLTDCVEKQSKYREVL